MWRNKRKGLAHVFYKDRLSILLDNLKDYVLKRQAGWLKSIASSPDGSAKIDISREFMELLQKYLMHIMFGTDIDDSYEVPLLVRNSSYDSYREQKTSISEAIEYSFEEALDAIPNRMPNYFLCRGKWPFAMSKTEKINNENCAATRDAIRDYVRKRVSGECKSDVAGNSDILSAMLESSEIFDEDDVIDELMDLMLAGTQTTHNTT